MQTCKGLVNVGGEVNVHNMGYAAVLGGDQQGVEEALGRVVQQLPVAAIVHAAPGGALFKSTRRNGLSGGMAPGRGKEEHFAVGSDRIERACNCGESWQG